MAGGDEHLRLGFSRETTIRRDERGRWFHDGERIETEAIERAFDRWVDLGEDGRYILKNEINWAFCHIEGAPIFVRRVRLMGDRAELELSDARTETLRPATLRQGPDGLLYCQVRDGRLTATFEREAAMTLAERLFEDEEGLYFAFEGTVFRAEVSETPLQDPAPE